MRTWWSLSRSELPDFPIAVTVEEIGPRRRGLRACIASIGDIKPVLEALRVELPERVAKIAHPVSTYDPVEMCPDAQS